MTLNKKVVWLPYDFDTAIGINNEGSLAFSYDLEDTDTISGADVYNGQDSVVWNNIRRAFGSELKSMYQSLRSNDAISYEIVEQMFENHQSKWSEAIFNEDAQFKYLDPLINDNDAAYLTMLQGSKAEQRKWWLWNRFRYLDSKYNAGDAVTAENTITLRAYKNGNSPIPSITVTPYASIYASVKYGSYLVQERAIRDEDTTLTNPLDNVNDTEVYIYSADQLADVGDLSGFYVGYANFSAATKLVNLKIGDSDSNYSNPNLGRDAGATLTLGNNTLLQTLDVRNCPNLTQAVDISGCTNIEEVYFDGTAITGLSLPNGGVLNTLHLPDTVTTLIIQNQPNLNDLVLNDSSGLTTLVLENVGSGVDSYDLFSNMQSGGRVRIIGFNWTVSDGNALIELLGSMRGIDANGNTTEYPQLEGTITVTGTILESNRTSITGGCPDVELDCTGATIIEDRFYIHQRHAALTGTNGIIRDAKYFNRYGWFFPYQCEIWLPDLTSTDGGILKSFLGASNGPIYLGIGKQGDTEVVPCSTTGFGNANSRIYVPDTLVNSYKSATNWSTKASQIYPLSEAPYEEWNGGVIA